MCGIVGIVAKHRSQGFWKSHIDLFTELLYADGMRGMDSTGVFTVTRKNQVPILKQATNPGIFLNTKSYKDFMEDTYRKGIVVVGHNRKATQGSITTKNAHPFVDKNIVLVHNGYIGNHKSIDESVEVDSQAIITSIDKEQDPVKGLNKLWGAFAVAFYNYNTKKFYIGRNNDRPMAFVHTSEYLFFASEGPMLDWILHRNKITAPKAFEIPVNVLFEISLSPFDIKELKLEKAPFTPNYNNYNSYQDDAHVPYRPRNEHIMTELERARSMASREAMNEDYATSIKDLQRRYPHESYVLFWPKSFSPMDGEKLVNVYGHAWVPGKPGIIAQSSVPTDEECYISPTLPLLGQVECVARRNNTIKLILKKLRPASDELKDLNGKSVSYEEWKMICSNLSCESCAKAPIQTQPDLTVITKRGYDEYEITCSKCVHDSTGGMSHGQTG